MKALSRNVLLLLVAGFLIIGPARDSYGWEKRFDVGLAVELELRDGREIPIFTVSIRNASTEPVSGVDVRGSAEIQAYYAPIEISALDPTISVGVWQARYADPRGSIVELAPGDGYKFIDKLSNEYSFLGRGRYRAQIVYIPDPDNWKFKYESSAVEFEITTGPEPRRVDLTEPPPIEEWTAICVANSDLCALYYTLTSPDTVLPRKLVLDITWDRETAGLRVLARQSISCKDLAIVLQVDDSVAESMKSDDYGYGAELSGERARVAVESFLAGEQVTLELHLAPDCDKYIVNIPLDGFPDAWAEFRAGLLERGIMAL